MSLKSQLRNKQSPVSRWMETYVNRETAKEFVREINDELVKLPILAVPANTNFQLVGTAFDYYFRWLLGPLDSSITAVKGAYQLQWKNAEAVVAQVITEGNSQSTTEYRRAQCTIILAWFESIYRSPSVPLEIAKAARYPSNDLTQIVDILYDQTPVAALEDILQLARSIPQVWKDHLHVPFILNPIFSGSRDVGGADADWITSGILYDCKCSIQPRPFNRETLLQALGYILLDYDDHYGIHDIGWYYARQQTCIVRSLSVLIPLLFGSLDLTELRQSFFAGLRTRQNREPRISKKENRQGGSVIELSPNDLAALLNIAVKSGNRIHQARMGGKDIVYMVTSTEGITTYYRSKDKTH